MLRDNPSRAGRRRSPSLAVLFCATVLSAGVPSVLVAQEKAGAPTENPDHDRYILPPQRIQEIFLRLADPGGSSDASDLLKAVWELQQEITAGLQQLASVLVGTDAEVRNALDELLEKYACRAVAAALTDGTGNVATLAERYAANAERVVKNRQDALLGFLHDQTNRVRSLYDNTVRTVEAGLEEVRAKKAVLLEDSTRLTTLWSAFEEAR